MNQVFTYDMTTYSTDRNVTRTDRIQASGSQDSRARRRLLDTLNAKGVQVRKLVTLDSRPAHS